MTVTLTNKADPAARTIHIVTKKSFESLGLDAQTKVWARANSFIGQPGKVLLVPGNDGNVTSALFGTSEEKEGFSSLELGSLSKQLPAGKWRFSEVLQQPELAILGLLLGSYNFNRYRKQDATQDIEVIAPDGVDVEAITSHAKSVFLTRDLINTPTNDMGPDALEQAVRELASRHGATVKVISGDDLLKQNFPMIHAVGRAAEQAPRLIDMVWGNEDAPKVTLVGKGVCFDTGGLDIKPASGMLLMKKDMGGAANVLGLASILMDSKVNLRLRVLIPAVENSIAGNAFRPGDVLQSRKGITVEIGNTDAEGRLVLADALAFADEEEPELIIDMATLTGAARVALGPDLPPFFTRDEKFAAQIANASEEVADPLWRLPLWSGYNKNLSSRIADINNVTSDGFAGAVTAALFLERFVEKAKSWAHFDVYGWSPVERPHCPVGGEAQGIRALTRVLIERFNLR